LGRPTPDGVQEALDVIEFASDFSLASFPLCPATYLEQLRNANARQRREVGTFMQRISKSHTMAAPVQALVQREVDLALRVRFGLPMVPTAFQVFGKGISHAIELDVLSHLTLPSAIKANPILDKAVSELIVEDMERLAICGADGEEAEPALSDDQIAHNFVVDEEDQARRFQECRASADVQHRTLIARELIRLLPLLVDASQRSAGPWQRMFEAGRDYLTAFVYDLPVISSQIEMLRQQHRTPQRGWRTSDQYDVVAFSMAVVHCDIIVIEKHWANLMRRSGLDKRFGTVILSSLSQLPEHLIRANAA
jgi:hypothetical protein